jgi:hypothetical protein
VKSPRRRTIAVLGTIAIHGLPLVTFSTCSLGIDVEMPEFEFELTEVEFIDPNQELGDGLPEPEPEPEPIVEPPPEPPPEEPPEGESEGPEEPEPEPEPEPKKLFGEKKSRVDKLGPANSNFFMLLNAKKTAGLPYAESIIEIMAALPDFQFVIDGGGFHPLRDFNYLVIASPDIRDVSQTFIAVEYKLTSEEVRAGLDRAAAGPEIVVKMGFLDKPAAEKFEGEWRELLPRFIDDKVPMLMRGMARGLYEQIDVERDDKGVTLRSEFSKTQATLILDQVASISSKMLRRTPEQMEAMRKRRTDLWEAREGGKLPPSAALEKLNAPIPEGLDAPPPAASSSGSAGDSGDAPPQPEDDAPAPVEPTDSAAPPKFDDLPLPPT